VVAPIPLDLSFGRAEIGSLCLEVLIGVMVSGDGRSSWYKDVQLITVYPIMALMFLFPTRRGPLISARRVKASPRATPDGFRPPMRGRER